MDPNTPNPATPQPTDGLIMPDQPDVQVTAEPTPIPVTNATPQPTPAPTPEAPASVPQPASTPEPAPEPDPLFTPVTEPDPLEVVPKPVAPTPAAPVTSQTMQRLDDGAKPVVVAATGQTVVAKTEKPHKSRRKTMLVLLIGLAVLAAVGFAVYTYFMKPNVSETETPAAIVSVNQLSPENLTQGTDKTELTAGSQTNSATLILSGSAPSGGPANLQLEVEIQPLGTDFTGTPTQNTIAVPDETDPLKVKLTDYAEGSYHWQARLSDGTNQGPWTAYNTGDDAGKTADFTIDRAVPTAALIKTMNGKNVTGKNVTSTVAQPVLTGTAEAGSTITVAFGQTASYKATTTAEGTWSVTAGAALPNSKYTLTVTSADPAGNATATTYTLTQSAR